MKKGRIAQWSVLIHFLEIVQIWIEIFDFVIESRLSNDIDGLWGASSGLDFFLIERNIHIVLVKQNVLGSDEDIAEDNDSRGEQAEVNTGDSNIASGLVADEVLLGIQEDRAAVETQGELKNRVDFLREFRASE